MGQWGSEHFVLNGLNFKGVNSPMTLERAVAMLPARVKQAFYGAAMRHGVIRRGTWNGCAFNQGAKEVEVLGVMARASGVTSTPASMEVFGVSKYLVNNFITHWDSSPYPNDKEATKALVGMLEKIGLYTDPDQPKVRIITHVVFEGNMTDEELMAEFRKELENPEFSFPELNAVEEMLGV